MGRTLAQAAEIPALGPCGIVVRVEIPNRAGEPDVGACYLDVKAAVDGIRDAGVWPDDSPRWVRWMTMHAPVVTGRNAVVIELHPQE